MEINQNNNNMIEIKLIENDEENEITNSKDDFLNNDELNNKVDLNYNNYKLLKENLIVKNNNLPAKINKEMKIKIKNYNLNKISSNPFLTRNSLPNHTQHNKKLKILPKTVYYINLKNENSNNKKEMKGKSIFSKISESILQNDKKNEKYPNKKIVNLEQINEDNYNKLTEELYLHSRANKNNYENKKIISEFLERKKKEEITKKIGIENDSNIMSEALKDLKRSNTLTDRNRSFKSSRTFGKFLQDQKNKEEKHKILLKRNELLQNEKINLNIRDRPLLNEESIKIMNNSVRNKMDIHIRLYKEFNDKKKREEEKIKDLLYVNKIKEKKMTQKKIDENSNRLFNEYKIKKNRNEELKYKKINEINNLTFNSPVSKNSNEIIFKKIIKKLKNALFIIFGKKLEDNFQINYFDFLKLLYSICFISKNYFELIQLKNNDKQIEKEIEFRISNDAWKIITKNKEFKNDIPCESKNLFFFILSVVGNIENKYIKKELEKCGIELNSNDFNLSSQIYKYFQLFRNNAINSLLFRDKKIKKEEIINENEKLDKNKKVNFNNNLIYLNIEKDNKIFLKNKENKYGDIEQFKNEENKKRYTYIPSSTQNNEKKNVLKYNENSIKYLNSSLKYISNDNNLNKNIKNNLINKSFNSNNNLRKMFLNNPLEKDNDIQKKINELKEARNQRKIEKIIKEKGLRINSLEDQYNNIYDYNQRFVHINEPLNNFKNTFKKYEKLSVKQKIFNNQRCVFEIFVENKPKKLILYKGENINNKINEFCNKYNLNYNDRQQIVTTINNQIKI